MLANSVVPVTTQVPVVQTQLSQIPLVQSTQIPLVQSTQILVPQPQVVSQVVPQTSVVVPNTQVQYVPVISGIAPAQPQPPMQVGVRVVPIYD